MKRLAPAIDHDRQMAAEAAQWRLTSVAAAPGAVAAAARKRLQEQGS